MKACFPADGPYFRAPWCATLRWVTWMVCAAVLGFVITLWIAPAPRDVTTRAAGTVAGLLLVAGTALFTIRGYRLEGRHLLVDRLLWSTRIPLEGFQSAEVAPDAMRRSIRLCGNGGLFAFTGWFRNRRLGTYRSFATDPTCSVVLHFPHRRIVVTPHDPQRFAKLVETRSG